MPFSNGDEQNVVARLRNSGNLILSMVATFEDQIVGHIAFSAAKMKGESVGWYALGPVSVLPEYQRMGVGSALIEAGLNYLQDQNALGCIVTGNPFYYCNFGFEVAQEYAPAEEPKEYFMLIQFADKKPSGRFSFDPAFYG